MSDVKLFDFSAELKNETDRAFLVNGGDKDFWLPKRFTENNGVTIPEWLAIERGIV